MELLFLGLSVSSVLLYQSP